MATLDSFQGTGDLTALNYKILDNHHITKKVWRNSYSLLSSSGHSDVCFPRYWTKLKPFCLASDTSFIYLPAMYSIYIYSLLDWIQNKKNREGRGVQAKEWERKRWILFKVDHRLNSNRKEGLTCSKTMGGISCRWHAKWTSGSILLSI